MTGTGTRFCALKMGCSEHHLKDAASGRARRGSALNQVRCWSFAMVARRGKRI
jgi:hypothetical protein